MHPRDAVPAKVRTPKRHVCNGGEPPTVILFGQPPTSVMKVRLTLGKLPILPDTTIFTELPWL